VIQRAMDAYDSLTPGTQLSRDDIVWTKDRVRGILFWIPTIVIGLAYLTQHNLLYAAGETIDYDQVSDLVAEAGSTNLLRQISFLSIGVVGIVLMWMQARDRSTTNAWLISGCFLECALMLASCVWADDSFQTFKRSLVTLLVLIAAVGVGKQWRTRELLLFVAVVTSTYLLIGISAEIVQGSFTLSNTHRLAGTQHPNTQGVNCALLALASFSLFAASLREKLSLTGMLWLVLAVVGVACLLLTRSRSATIALGCAFIAFMFLGASRNRKVLYASAILQLAAIGGVLWYASDSQDGFVSAVKMGREQDTAEITTLTGRIPIWGAVLERVGERPMFGYGFGGFWTSRRVEEFSSLFNWTFMHSHSAYLETLLNVGIVGLLLGLTVVTGTIVASLRAFRRTGDQGFRFVVALFLFALVHGALDSNFARDGIETFIGALAIAVVAFHAVPAIATGRNESVAAIDQGGEVKSFAFATAGPTCHSDLNLLGR
jgi:exopolysaccharide production protein ExoQ